MRLRRAAAAATLLALLAAGSIPAADPCLVSAQTPHRCCAGKPPTPAAETDGCCSGAGLSGRSPSTAPAADAPGSPCDCLHAPAVPAAAAVAGPTSSTHEADLLAHRAAAWANRPIGESMAPPSERRPPSNQPLLFLLDCAFLI